MGFHTIEVSVSAVVGSRKEATVSTEPGSWELLLVQPLAGCGSLSTGHTPLVGWLHPILGMCQPSVQGWGCPGAPSWDGGMSPVLLLPQCLPAHEGPQQPLMTHNPSGEHVTWVCFSEGRQMQEGKCFGRVFT